LLANVWLTPRGSLNPIDASEVALVFCRTWRADGGRGAFHYSTFLKTSSFGALLAIIIPLLQGCGWARSSQPGLTSQTGGAEDVINPVKVSTAEAITRQISLSINATGSFIADEVSDIGTEAEGLVVATPVNIGDFVRKGAVIARLDEGAANLRLQQAIA